MKSKIVIMLFFYAVFSADCFSFAVQGYKDDSINQTLLENDSTIIDLISDLQDKVIILDNKNVGENKPSVYIIIEVISIVLGVITLLVTITFVWVLRLLSSIQKDSKEIKKDTNKIIIEANSKIEKFKSDSDKLLNEFKGDVKKIHKIEKEISKHRSYLHQSVEVYYDLFLFLANNIKNTELLEMTFIKRSVSQVYSINENERFTGITTLGECGSTYDIKHLEYVILNPDETKENKLIANDAIVKIKTKN